jgi:hypothetical protein
MTLVCRLQWTGSAPLNSSRRITERLGSSLQKSSDICFATHRRPTRAHSRASAMLMPTPTSCCSLLHLLKAKSSFCIWFARTRTWGTTTLTMISCHPGFVSPAADALAITQDFVRQRLRWNFAAKRLQKCDKVRLFARGEMQLPDLGVKPTVRISSSRVKVDYLR